MNRRSDFSRGSREIPSTCVRQAPHSSPREGELEIYVDEPLDTFIEDLPLETEASRFDPEPVEVVLAELPDPCTSDLPHADSPRATRMARGMLRRIDV
jgi:hypothetical protein